MPSTVEQLSPVRVKLTVEIPFADLKPSINKVYKQISQRVQIPGFRKGKVPAAIIDQRVGRGSVLQDAINDYLPTAYLTAIDEHKIAPLGQPEIEITKLEDGKEVEFTAELNVRPEFELPEFSTIEVSVDAAEVTEEQINERLDLMRDRFAIVNEVDRAAAEGDQVVIDLVATKDGEALEDATAEGVSYVIGNGGMVDGMDEALTGKKAGEKAVFTSKLVGGQFKDVEAEISVDVKSVQSRELPAVDDEFAQMVSAFDTVDEMMKDLRTSMENAARITQVNTARDKALEQLVAKTEFELPQDLVEQEVEAQKARVTQQLSAAGLTVERYLADTEYEEGKDEAEFFANIEKRTVESLRAQIILDKLVDEQQPEVGQDELLQLIYQKAMMNGSSPQAELKHMMEHEHQGEWMHEVRRGKVLSKLVREVKVSDTNGNVIDLDAINQDGSLKDDAEVAEKAPVKKPATKKPAAKKATAEKAEKAEAKKPAAKKAPAKKTEKAE